MANGYTLLNKSGVPLGGVSQGDAIDEEDTTYTAAPTTRKKTRVVIGGNVLDGVDVVLPLDTTPVGTEYGLPTRNIPSTATAGAPVGITVSNVAIVVQAANVARKSIVITNNGTSNIFIGVTNAVTTSGATMGIKIAPGGTYQDSGDGRWVGDIYAIGDAVSAAQNVSSWERT